MHREEMLSLFQQHRKAEAARDFDAIMATFVEDCYLETVPLNLRIEGRTAARAAYAGYFTAFPDLSPDDEGFAFGDDVVVTWGSLRGTSKGDWFGIPPSGRAFALQRMAGESIHFDLATLCDQGGLPIERIRAAAQIRAQALRSQERTKP
jgi:predicted ester cyclase